MSLTILKIKFGDSLSVFRFWLHYFNPVKSARDCKSSAKKRIKKNKTWDGGGGNKNLIMQ